MTFSSVTYRTNQSRMNKTFGSRFTDSGANPQDKNKMSVIKKIIMISSMKNQIKKIFLKIIDHGISTFNQQQQDKIISISKTILDNDRQKQLSEDLAALANQNCDFFGMLLKLVKTFVISPLEKSYIVKIEKELKEDQQLQYQIKNIEFDITQQKKKKLQVYELQKSGRIIAQSTKINNASKEAQNFENKLMRANQKLNELSSNNNKLRDKINQLRKEKNAMQDIYVKLKKQLEEKKQNVQNTIKSAGQAYCARNQAEQDLRKLKEQAENKKEQFKQDCQKLNNQIQHDIRFKQFIKSKLVEKQQLQKLEQQIKENQKQIEIKKQENSRIQNQYQKSISKQMQIMSCFQRIKKQIGIGDVGAQNQGKELLNIFINLYEKNAIMKRFVQEISSEIKQLQDRIQNKKQQIQKMYLKGSADECDHQKLNADLKKKYQYQQRKKQILNKQYQKSVETIQTIKKYLQDIFQQINVDPEVTNKLKNCHLNQQNLTQFLGQLQKKGLEAISYYGKLVSEQLKSQKGNNWQIQKQIDQLNNIITLENVNSMNNPGLTKSMEYPSELIIKIKDEKIKEEQIDKPMTTQQLKKFAIQSLQLFQKKQTPIIKNQIKKYNVAPMVNKQKKKQLKQMK